MKKITIKAALATGLAHRLNTMDAQVVVDAVGTNAIKAVRSNQRVADKFKESNTDFEKAVELTEKKKRAVFEELQAKFGKDSEGMDEVAKQKMGRDLTADFNKKAAEIQKESTAKPDELIVVELSDEDYDTVLMRVFQKTVQMWDVNGDGNGQKLFLEVADALEKCESV
jgi:hypothetical protein